MAHHHSWKHHQNYWCKHNVCLTSVSHNYHLKPAWVVFATGSGFFAWIDSLFSLVFHGFIVELDHLTMKIWWAVEKSQTPAHDRVNWPRRTKFAEIVAVYWHGCLQKKCACCSCFRCCRCHCGCCSVLLLLLLFVVEVVVRCLLIVVCCCGLLYVVVGCYILLYNAVCCMLMYFVCSINAAVCAVCCCCCICCNHTVCCASCCMLLYFVVWCCMLLYSAVCCNYLDGWCCM